ncbi:hypothetical protein HPB52_006893 [Rhipicephalus sanguineus]|uniref:Helicase C-terminal domain-containing protein n=1 Tax=Rhipicephalus sanguineus TaxID=34632 RepID=A0A9D4PAZ3_RHISA|nr:hypothetical protein HPB52_006893 [Rhipicephalus sanguineus]
MAILNVAEAVMDVMVEIFLPPPMNLQPFNFQDPNANQPRPKVAPAYRQALGDSSRSVSEMLKKRKCTVRVHKRYDVHPLCEDLLDDYVQVNVGVKTAPFDRNVEQIPIVCDEAEKNNRLVTVLEDILNEGRHKVIVFVETKQTVDDVATLLLLRDWPVVGVHGNKRDDELDWALAAFRGDGALVLVSTDMCARKLDVAGGVRYVINYDYPRSSEVYKRRLEHASHSNGVGVAYTFFTHQDKRHAWDFVSILCEAGVVVPRELTEMAKETARDRRVGVSRTGELRVE